MTKEEFKLFIHEFRIFIQKYNIRVKADSEEIEFGKEGIAVLVGDGLFRIERAVGVLFLEMLTPEEARKEEAKGTLIIGR